MEGGRFRNHYLYRFYNEKLHSLIDGYVVDLIFCLTLWAFPLLLTSWVFLKPCIGYYLIVRHASLNPFFSVFKIVTTAGN